ncbi:hypothetical protein [Pseudochryseolinea flava]|uniref:Uncharacterized protein n=1 Tax=Pseudochryseolinea flava TaxID=2059302 RepID=A0A364XY30_9BACT|nr:hypothetical protein [Pseudochryseolinea flava]RAV98899.1 hypothetical protein DQQ10_21600 [Pseudochryseolinea flava]
MLQLIAFAFFIALLATLHVQLQRMYEMKSTFKTVIDDPSATNKKFRTVEGECGWVTVIYVI